MVSIGQDGVHGHADLRFCTGAAGHPGCHGGHAAAQLEGERRRGLEHHHGHLADAGPVDGLHLVQHRDVQLHTQVLRIGAACVPADGAHHHGAVLRPGRTWALPGVARA